MSNSLSDITSKGPNMPIRMVFHGVEGFGKTSFGAMFPAPIFLQARGETGLEALIDAGQLPETPHFPETNTWQEMLGQIQVLTTEKHEYKTLVIDTLNGFERLCHEHVCQRDYRGDWGETGFTSYHKGFLVALGDWRMLISALDNIRKQRNMRIICLCHTAVCKFSNPDGTDYDRYEPELHKKTWGLTHKWADMVLFGNYVTVVDKKDGKGKGGTARMLYAQRSAAWDAKNRHGLPPAIKIGNTPKAAYDTFIDVAKEAKNKSQNGGKEK